jgi:hypothetical protein
MLRKGWKVLNLQWNGMFEFQWNEMFKFSMKWNAWIINDMKCLNH